MSYKVYKITSPIGRSYIGVTKLPLKKRWHNGHGYQYLPELWEDIITYGWISFSKELVATYENEMEAREREHLEIKKYPDGYNRYRGEKGYVPSENPRTPPKPVVCTETGVKYDSIKDAARKTGLAKNKISYCCRGIRKTTGGFHWQFAS